jgi:hypothetical protein
MISNIRNELVKIISEIDWMDNESKKEAIDKVRLK